MSDNVSEAWFYLANTLGDRCDWCDPHGDMIAPYTTEGKARVAKLPRDSTGHPHEIKCKWLRMDQAVSSLSGQ